MTVKNQSSLTKQSWQNVRGKLNPMVDLDKLTWFGVGGPAEWLFEPADIEDLKLFLKRCPKEIPIQVLGAGSNILIRDGGIRGITVKLSGFFTKINFYQPHKIIAGAGAGDADVARFAAKNKIS